MVTWQTRAFAAKEALATAASERKPHVAHFAPTRPAILEPQVVMM